MNNLIFSTNAVATLFYLSVGLISIVMYNKANSSYFKTESRITSYTSFMYVYKLIQLSTLSVCLLSIWTDYSYLYKVFYNSDIFKYVGISISALGIFMFSIARFSLGNNYSPCFDSYLPKSINTKGIYSVVRHPIYTANLLLMVGIFISSASAVIIVNATILLFYYSMSAFTEEKAIEKKFPAYKLYKTRTGMFFPNFVKGLTS